ncbi:MAG: diaminopropionate ammonia-lyase [Cetobacterium sp.]|uniref:diaminopropionate ammonia-lyase n=1 Tax=Cetobacterium sp. TaxID=2071632 RepID=UPI002FC7F956
MEKEIKWCPNNIKKHNEMECINFLTYDEVKKAKEFHESFPQYSSTPLTELKNLANLLEVNTIFVKDESYRFGLNAFKVLGGSFAMAKFLAERLEEDISNLPYERLISEDIKKKLGEVTFYTATDGNHGRGVAWTANKLKQKSVVYMPFGSSITRLNNIKAEGAEASITDMNYDDAVRLAAVNAEKTNGIIIQDTAWNNYEKIPSWIMQGYGTMVLESIEQLRSKGIDKPTHIFIQAGVGSLAGAVQGVFSTIYGKDCPKVVVVESNLADCLYKSALAKDGIPRFVGGSMQTIMAGLACGEPNTIGWEILKNHSTAFVSCPDWIAANGMRILGNPLSGDSKIISGESGAVTLGLFEAIMKNEKMKSLKIFLELDNNSKVLFFSTEGDTAPDKYREIVWLGKYSGE